MFRRLQLSLLALCTFVTLSGIVAAPAFALSGAQETCVNTLNKGGAKVAGAQGKENSGCVKAATTDKLPPGQTTDQCVTADPKDKVQKAKDKTVDGDATKCTGPDPAIGYAGPAAVNAAAQNEELDLLEDIFGVPLDTAMLADDAGKCQTAVVKSYEKLAQARLKEFNSCKKTGFKNDVLTTQPELEACVGSDSKLKVDKARTKLESTVVSKCEGVPLASAFLGCSSEAGSSQALSDCVARNVECHMCLALNAMDAMEAPCDAHDDGAVNQTCRQCGNGATEAPEQCDDAGNSATCDSDCTLAACGDGFTNGAAGETCDTSGESATCDDDCTAPVCTDGNLNTAAGEVCDDGNVTNGDGCDNNCTVTACGNGIVTLGEECDDGNATNGDGCDNNCTFTACGNGIITAGEVCDDDNLVDGDGCDSNCTPTGCNNGIVTAPEACDTGGESATCDDDCTLPACHDGNHNAAAGEQCDDGNLSDNDSCVGACVLATCGDGFLCSAGGCTTGPGGGLEECDDGGANSNVLPDACRTNCRNAFCGDGVTDTGEACDGGGVNTMTCDSNCTTAVCGDGFVNSAAGEQCDGGGETMTCDSNCTNAMCGDGTVNMTAGEDCDDGNTTSGDGCSSTCQSGPGSGEQDADCPNLGELVLLAGAGGTCTTNGDCGAGSTCDTGLGRCTTVTDLDTGWKGIAHNADINDEVTTLGNLLCEGPGPTCGQCTIQGINPDTRSCRCANNNRTICDEPFVVDTNDCGAGVVCDCYFGPPLPLSAGNTPACILNRFSEDITGTANVDAGSGSVTANLRSRVFLGIVTHTPCPACGGTCTAGTVGASCVLDEHCDTSLGAGDGVCGNYDPTPNDGVRGGTCYLGANNNQTCDVDAPNTSFPANGGGGHSLDCFPNTSNVSGAGLKITITQTTGMQSLSAGVPCGIVPEAPRTCPCGECSNDASTPCTSNAQCSDGGVCQALGAGEAQPNDCAGEVCDDSGDGITAECATGPDNKYCDAYVRANGKGFQSCSSNADCDEGVIGFPAGNCTLTERRACFLDPILANGSANPTTPIGAGIFCIARTANGAINATAGLPGPGRVVNQGRARTFCASDNNVQYTPGVGGCP